jgi:3-isopropylmalate dehydrogenase
MRIKITMLFDGDLTRGLMRQTEQTLTEIAVAFGHTFVLKQEKIAQASLVEYGMELTEETIQSCRQADLVLACVNAESAVPILADELGCYARVRSFAMPDVLKPLSPLRAVHAPNGMVTQALTADPGKLRALVKFALDYAQSEGLALAHVPSSGSTRDFWMEAVLGLGAGEASFCLREAAEAIPFIIKSPENFGFILAAQYPGYILLPAVTALFGVPGILFDEYKSDRSNLYVHHVSYTPLGIDDANPIGLQRAASAFLRSRFGMSREADCVDAAIHNVLEAGWRTSDIAMAGFPRISMSAMGKLIAEQVSLAGNFMNR